MIRPEEVFERERRAVSRRFGIGVGAGKEETKELRTEKLKSRE